MTEKFVRYADDVPDLQAAFTFVMERLDEFPAPSVEISPVWSYGTDDVPDGALSFTVTVSGHVS